uniref:G protein-coupled receptor n=1 Tax=Haemonchus contortus TaxID=6289 RepID=A0A7I5EBL8_HAECO
NLLSDMMSVEDFVAIASYFTIFVSGTVLNIIFIYVIINGTRSAVGQAYKHILISFAICNIIFASMEFIAKPGIFIYGTSLMTFSHGFFQSVKPWGFLSLCIFITMYGINTALLTLHFVYRYIVLCRHNLLHIFEESASIAAVTLSVLSWGFIYGFITFYCFAATDDYYEYANPSVYTRFGVDAHSLSFFCIFTHKVVGGVTTIYWLSTLGLGLIFLMMIITFGLMLFCGVEMYRTLKRTSMSQKSKALQTQLLKALAVQSLLFHAIGCIYLHSNRSDSNNVLHM